MPLVVICGRPCVGKTSFARYLCDVLSAVGHETSVVNDEILGISKATGYKDATAEKISRAKLKSTVERLLTSDRVVIADALNYIKGFRYELFLAVRTARTTHCVAWVDAPLPDALAENEARAAAAPAAAAGPLVEGYPPAVLADLWSRFEVPDERVRWDDPLVHVAAAEGAGAEAAARTRAAAGPAPAALQLPREMPGAVVAAAPAEAPPQQRKTAFKRTGVRVVLGAGGSAGGATAPPLQSLPLAAAATGGAGVALGSAFVSGSRAAGVPPGPGEGDAPYAAGARSAASSPDGGFGSCDEGSGSEAAAGAADAFADSASLAGRPHPGDSMSTVGGGRRQRQQQQPGGKGRGGSAGLPAFDEGAYASAAAAALSSPPSSAAAAAPLPPRFAVAALAVARALFQRRAYKPTLAVLPEPAAPPHFISELHTRVEAAAAELEAAVPAGSDSLPVDAPLAVAGSPVQLRLDRPQTTAWLRRQKAEFMRVAAGSLEGFASGGGGLDAIPRRFVEFLQQQQK